jgi:hypothetical protein
MITRTSGPFGPLNVFDLLSSFTDYFSRIFFSALIILREPLKGKDLTPSEVTR